MDYVDDVLQTVLTLKNKPVLIGHSMGGAVVQKLLYLYPDKFKAAVLLATVPPNGMLKDLLRLTFTNFNKARQMFLFNNGKSESFPASLLLSNELSPEKIEKYTRLLQPESTKACKELVGNIVPKSINVNVPILVVNSKKDCMFSERTGRYTAKVYKTEPVILENVSHDMMLDPNWKLVADQILTFLREIVL